MEQAVRALRIHIGIFGRTNSGKSSLLNALAGQQYAVVSPVAGTTTDPVYKPMELHGIGAAVCIDTAGFGDTTLLGTQRMEKTQRAVCESDIALVVFTAASFREDGFQLEAAFVSSLKKSGKPLIPVLNTFSAGTELKTIANHGESGCSSAAESSEPPSAAASEPLAYLAALEVRAAEAVARLCGEAAVRVNACTGSGIDALKERIHLAAPKDGESRTLTGSLCAAGDLVLLVMPQDAQAPKGRLILPQVQIIRELLDKKCLIQSCTHETLASSLRLFVSPPHLIITDSQVFKAVHEQTPRGTLLTSFSVLMAAAKGDIHRFLDATTAIQNLTADSRVLIAEACTHSCAVSALTAEAQAETGAPTEDIGRVKIPRMLRAFVAQKTREASNAADEVSLRIDFANGSDFPSDLSRYSLIIHCGACMYNRAYMLSRQQAASDAGVPLCNYGLTIAFLQGILDDISIPY